MDNAIDWNVRFVASLPIGGFVLRGTAVDLFFFFVMRILRRGRTHRAAPANRH
jgi:hypothetical protein